MVDLDLVAPGLLNHVHQLGVSDVLGYADGRGISEPLTNDVSGFDGLINVVDVPTAELVVGIDGVVFVVGVDGGRCVVGADRGVVGVEVVVGDVGFIGRVIHDGLIVVLNGDGGSFGVELRSSVDAILTLKVSSNGRVLVAMDSFCF